MPVTACSGQEGDTTFVERAELPALAADRLDDPAELNAFLDAVRWGAVTSADQIGRAMLEVLVGGTTDPEVFADLALGSCTRRSPRCAKRSKAASRRCRRC